MKHNFFIVIFIIFFLLLKTIAFSKVVLVIPPRKNLNDNTIHYMEYAVSDILYKNLFLFSKVSPMLESENKLDYSATKGSISKIVSSYSADVVITYSVQKYRNGYTLDIFIYSIKKSKGWYEYILYSKEEDFYKSINAFIEEVYKYSDIEFDSKNIHTLESEEYLSLAVYYSDLTYSSADKDLNLYKRFNTFHKNNLYFNMDYLSLLNKENENDSYEKVIKDISKTISKKHHYIKYMYALRHYNIYKKSGLLEDINKAVIYINEAVLANNKNYNYYDTLGDIYLLNNDYSNSILAYKDALKIYSKDIYALNNLIFIYMKDMDKYVEDIIEYSNMLIRQDIVKEDVLEALISIYKNAGDKDNELYYAEMLLDYINKEIARIKAYQLGASLLYKYTLKQKNVEKEIKLLKDRKY